MTEKALPIIRRNSRPKSDWRRLLRPGGAGDRIIFGYMFRVISAVGAVLFASVLTILTVAITGNSEINGVRLFVFTTSCLTIIALGEFLRAKVYEDHLSKAEIAAREERSSNSLNSRFQEVAANIRSVDDKRIRAIVRKKRIFDIAISLLGLFLMSPLIFATSLLIKFDSPGPILFRQERVGKDGKRIYVTKFRSMRADSLREKPFVEIASRYEEDPRITRVGSFLRRTSIDELPQLFDVLRGDMSIVGPRPLSIVVVNALEKRDESLQYQIPIRPGITGLWSGDPRIDRDLTYRFEEYVSAITLQTELYLQDWSIRKDIRAVLRAIGLMVTDRV